MFIGETQSKTIRREVLYGYLNADGEYGEARFNIWVKRLTFQERASKTFQEKFKAIVDDNEQLVAAIVPLIADWELFSDVECTVKCPVTAEFLLEQDQNLVQQIADAIYECVIKPVADPKPKPSSSGLGSEQTVRLATQATN